MLHCSWNVNGTMPKLAVIDTAQNNFSGVIPQGWGIPGVSFLVTKGAISVMAVPFWVPLCTNIKASPKAGVLCYLRSMSRLQAATHLS